MSAPKEVEPVEPTELEKLEAALARADRTVHERLDTVEGFITSLIERGKHAADSDTVEVTK